MTAVGAEQIKEAPILQLRFSCLAAFDGWSFDELESADQTIHACPGVVCL
jgi:hypothetical protein